ncbi:PhnD/SsuA/transferrin family substrate-binding protein [Desulfosporosinus sp. PR]|uniref:PhnD/SsuA/transferrin family substrate-binding protein n=1 Tax=Candidatus Desulfosporosinus nitrosoreducens TaxID=3401928 RepID=UPI0027E82541|nr:PhnD/SsuA/transferrin family substrate-binding protein [Desulfosporosinus sp. PR]MDQ7092539.1 PhnD/SsuA/transferrin family substrate-binding protein [Desulfosporosinus sp. PR]
MKKVPLLTLVVMLVSALLAGCGTTPSTSSSATGDVKDPAAITIAWLPNNAGEDFKDTRAAIDQAIEKATGLKVVDKLTTDYAITVEAIASGNAQLAYLGGESYVEAHSKNPKVVPLVVNSGDSGTLKDALYYSRILVKKGNEDQYKSGDGYSIDNIAGKKYSFVSTSSTSGFKVPTSLMVSYFSKQDKWKNLKAEDLLQGGNGKFFSQVLFGGSHQLSLVNLLTGKSDVSSVDDVDVSSYVDLTAGKDNTPGAVYTVKENAADPFSKLAGAQYVVIKSIPVINGPIAVNTSALSKKTVDAMIQVLTSAETTKNEKIFIPKDSKAKGFFNAPQRFLATDDSLYQPIRDLSN